MPKYQSSLMKLWNKASQSYWVEQKCRHYDIVEQLQDLTVPINVCSKANTRFSSTNYDACNAKKWNCLGCSKINHLILDHRFKSGLTEFSVWFIATIIWAYVILNYSKHFLSRPTVLSIYSATKPSLLDYVCHNQLQLWRYFISVKAMVTLLRSRRCAACRLKRFI